MEIRSLDIETALKYAPVVILPPMEAHESTRLLQEQGIRCASAILDPWYNRGIGEVLPLEDYDRFIERLLAETGEVADVMYLWGFPEIIGAYARRAPGGFAVTWLTWFYKNCPSVIRGWRSAQQSCIQFRREGVKLYPENFLDGEKLERYKAGNMRFVPGPPSVIEAPMPIGFVGKKEQTGHPAQKPEAAISPLVLMASAPGDVIFDPMAGSGTTAAVAVKTGRKAIVCDKEEKYIQLIEKRIGVKRLQP